MIRPVLALLAALTLLPGTAAAQFAAGTVASPWGPRLRVTPWVGFAPSFTRAEERVVVAGGVADFDEVDVSVGSGPAAGLTVETRVWGRFGIMASGLWMRRGDTEEYAAGPGVTTRLPGSDLLAARAGVVLRLLAAEEAMQLRPVSAALFVAPTLAVDRPREDALGTEGESATAVGVTFGVDGEVPLGGSRFAVHFGVEDLLLWWDEEDLAERARQWSGAEDVELSADPTHAWLLRLGLSFRFL